MNEQPFPTSPAAPKTGLSITSLILGIISLACGLFTGVPAAITGFIAHGRAKRQPEIYGGASMALAGAILGLVGSFLGTISLIAVMASLLLPALAKAKYRAQTISCVSNMKQIGLAARLYSNDHGDKFPPNFLAMSNELASPKILICPNDSTKTAAADWSHFDPNVNVSYEFLTPNAKEGDIARETAFRCPVHGNIGLGDGSVQQVPRGR